MAAQGVRRARRLPLPLGALHHRAARVGLLRQSEAALLIAQPMCVLRGPTHGGRILYLKIARAWPPWNFTWPSR